MDSNFRSLTAEDRAISRRRSALQGSRPLVTGTEVSGPLSSEASGASCVVNVTFTPTSTGNKTGTLAIRTNGSPTTFNVALTGTGTSPTPVLALSPTRATLTCSTPYGGPVYTSIAASNTGTATVTLP